MTQKQDPLARFWKYVNKTDTCWLWTGHLDREGYGKFRGASERVRAHKFAYESLVGPVPDGLVLDHVVARGCTNRHCVNPAHLEPVTCGENIRRGRTGCAQTAKTHCPQGHEYTPENTRISRRNERICKACARQRCRDDYWRRKGRAL